MASQQNESLAPALTARRLMRTAATATLATLDKNGAPFASLVTMATTTDCQPLLLLSDLAVHTGNLKRDARASLLVCDGSSEADDPLTGARLTVSGSLRADPDPNSRRRFLAHHEEAAGYVDFGDFAFYRFTFTGGHLVAGFGRIFDLEADELRAGSGDARALIDAEVGAIEHMNADHADAIRLYATVLLGLPDGAWRITGLDPEGVSMRAGPHRGFLPFPEPVTTTGELRKTLVDLAARARAARTD